MFNYFYNSLTLTFPFIFPPSSLDFPLISLSSTFSHPKPYFLDQDNFFVNFDFFIQEITIENPGFLMQ